MHPATSNITLWQWKVKSKFVFDFDAMAEKN
jgi:hypothetical protein